MVKQHIAPFYLYRLYVLFFFYSYALYEIDFLMFFTYFYSNLYVSFLLKLFLHVFVYPQEAKLLYIK